jgi:hypothetical protein
MDVVNRPVEADKELGTSAIDYRMRRRLRFYQMHILSPGTSHLELKFIASLWTKSADQILASVKRVCHKTQQTLCGEL